MAGIAEERPPTVAEEEEEENVVGELGSYKGQVRLVSDCEEEIILLWSIQQPIFSKNNVFVSQSSLQLKIDACGRSLSILQSQSSLVVWSFALACLDIHALTSNKDLYNHVIVSLFVVGDLVTATLSLAAACSSAGVIVLFERDTNICRVETKFACDMFQISIAFAFASWFVVAISSCIMFWLVASILLFRPSFVSIAPTLCTYCSFFNTI